MQTGARRLPVHRMAAFILALLIMLPMHTAWGASDRAAWLTSGEGHRGDTVRVSLLIDDAKDIAGLELAVSYDTTRLAAAGSRIHLGEALTGFVSDQNVIENESLLKFSAASSSKVAQSGQAVLMTIDFVVKNDAPEGNAYVNLSDLLVTDGSGRIAAHTANGVVAVLASGGGQSGGQGGGSTPPPAASEDITVVVDTEDGSAVAATTIRRTANADGTKQDVGVFDAARAREAVDKAKASGKTTVRLVIPDAKDEVARLELTFPKAAADELARGGISLEIQTDNGKVSLPSAALQGLTEDLYFRFVPIKSEAGRDEVEQRAKVEQAVQEAAGGRSVEAIARPMTIETNLPPGRSVDIVLPLLNVDLPADASARSAYLAGLAVFIEHSDGERELAKTEAVEYKPGQWGLRFAIDKFSTFAILRLGASNGHEAYMSGYPDATFKPDRAISRAEMATVLYRIGAGGSLANGPDAAFPDVAPDHWASEAIRYASAKGLMNGFPDGAFKPEKPITRAEMATIVGHWLGLQGEEGKPFPDTVGHWAQASIALVRQAGVIAGFPDGTFKPEKSLTRAEAVTMINKIEGRGSKNWTTATWSDVPATHWAFKDIEEASVPHAFTTDSSGSEIAQPH